jgi:hypothetical protein
MGEAGSAEGLGTAGTSDAGNPDGAAGASGHTGDADVGECTCPTDDSPVCGNDGRTYATECEAACAGAMVVHQGACPDGGLPNGITLKLVVPANRAYCDQPVGCSSPEHFHILAPGGQEVPFSRPACLLMCSTVCDEQPCPPVACVAQHATAFTGAQVDWNGDFYYAMSKCGTNMTCYEVASVSPGQYVARMCATPGTLSGSGAASSCAATGPTACVDVPFTFPGSGVVTGQLP